MQIVIDIDDNLYARLFDNGVDHYDDAKNMATAIRGGAPLPKGHGNLKDADKIIHELNEMKVQGETFTTAVNFAKILMREAPTIIEADTESEGNA